MLLVCVAATDALSAYILVAAEAGIEVWPVAHRAGPPSAGTVPQDQLRSVTASPAMMARAIRRRIAAIEREPVAEVHGWLGDHPWPCSPCGQVAMWTMNGWHKKASPARPVACVTGLHRTDGRQNWPSALVPASPYGARNSGTYRCEPQTSRVGASSGPTSVNSSRASSPRARERMLAQYPPGPS